MLESSILELVNEVVGSTTTVGEATPKAQFISIALDEVGLPHDLTKRPIKGQGASKEPYTVGTVTYIPITSKHNVVINNNVKQRTTWQSK